MKQYVGRVLSVALVCLFLLGAGFDFLSYFEMTEPGYVALGILFTAVVIADAIGLTGLVAHEAREDPVGFVHSLTGKHAAFRRRVHVTAGHVQGRSRRRGE